MATFSVIVINYNGKEYLKKSLPRIKKSTVQPEKVIVVDDASTDGSQDFVRKHFPDFFLKVHKENSGPPTARNTGAKQAVGKYLIFLDNDVLVKPHTLEQLISFMEEDGTRGICSPVLITDKGDPVWWSAGYDFGFIRSILGKLFLWIWWKLPYAFVEKISEPFTLNLNLRHYRHPQSVDWVSEACNIVRKDVFEEVGGFDEKFFMAHEGPDLCLRVRAVGYTVYFNPCIQADLLEGHSHNHKKRRKWIKQSTLYYYKKHYFSFFKS